MRVSRSVLTAALVLVSSAALTAPTAPASPTAKPAVTAQELADRLAVLQAPVDQGPAFMSLEIAPEVTGSFPSAGLYRLWDMGVAWKDVKPTREGGYVWDVLDMRVNQALAAGGRPMLVLGLTPAWAASDPNAGDPRWGLGTASPPANNRDWADYVINVVQRYRGRIAGYEVWNEANLQTFWTGTPAQMAELTSIAYGIITGNDPGAFVTTPSTTTRLRGSAKRFTESFLQASQQSGYGFDAFAIHTYPAGDLSLEEAPLARVDDIKAWQMVVAEQASSANDPLLRKPIFDTEVNYGLAGPGTRPGRQFSDAEGAQLLRRTFADSAALGIDSTFWYMYTQAPFSLLGVQMWSGTPAILAAWNDLRASGVTSSQPNSDTAPPPVAPSPPPPGQASGTIGDQPVSVSTTPDPSGRSVTVTTPNNGPAGDIGLWWFGVSNPQPPGSSTITMTFSPLADLPLFLQALYPQSLMQMNIWLISDAGPSIVSAQVEETRVPRSTAIPIATLRANGNGVVRETIELPKDLAPGNYILQFAGRTASNERFMINIAVQQPKATVAVVDGRGIAVSSATRGTGTKASTVTVRGATVGLAGKTITPRYRIKGAKWVNARPVKVRKNGTFQWRLRTPNEVRIVMVSGKTKSQLTKVEAAGR